MISIFFQHFWHLSQFFPVLSSFFQFCPDKTGRNRFLPLFSGCPGRNRFLPEETQPCSRGQCVKFQPLCCPASLIVKHIWLFMPGEKSDRYSFICCNRYSKGESWLKALWLNFFFEHQTLKPAAVAAPRSDSICLFDPTSSPYVKGNE